MNNVLVINSGSSSIKYQLVDVESGDALASGIIERIGLEVGKLKHEGPNGKTELEQPIPDHEVGMRLVLDTFAQQGPAIQESELAAVGHRIVQGGDVFDGPALVTDEVLAQIEELSPLAPLHNPANAAGIRAARAAFPNTPHVAVFDTAFHRTMPPAAYTSPTSRPVTQRMMSKSCTEQSRKMPPDAAMYAAGGGAGSSVVERTVCRSPSSPPRTASRAATKPASNRRLKPIWIGTSSFSTALSTRTPSAIVRATGFSQKTGTPASAQERISAGWASVAAATTTPSTPAASTASGESATCAPNRSAAAFAASANGSETTRDSTASSPDRVSA